MKYFISQAMNGRTDDEILKERKSVIKAIEEADENAEIIDSFFESAPYDAKPLWFLGKSFELLSGVDVCVFVNDAHKNARGCKMEYEACKNYGIRTVDLNLAE